MKEFQLAVNGKGIDIRVFLAQNFFDKAKGLMFSNRKDRALLILSCNSIHTFFMRFTIDAVFLNSQNRIVKILKGIKPFRAVLPVASASKVLELPAGTYDVTLLKSGDELSFIGI